MALLGAQFVNAVSPNPVGSLQAFAGASAPTGWLLCDGSAVSRTVYPELFSVLGTTYGAGDGSTTFGLPDLRGRMPIGAGNDGTAANNATRTRGDKGGDTRLQQHNHVYVAPHNNTVTTAYANSSNSFLQTGAVDAGTSNAGSGSGENMPPFLVTNYIIKAVPDAPRSGLAYGSTPPIVTALPTNPQFGDVVTYIADATNGVAWNLQYDASGTYPWKFIGGAPIWVEYTGDEAVASTSFTSFTNGPTLTIPAAGDYMISWGGAAAVSISGAQGHLAVKIGSTTPADNTTSIGASDAGNRTGVWTTRRCTGISASTAVVMQARLTSGQINVSNRRIIATPIRVKAA